jgi:putative membrane protein insertion efficiency factor
MLAALLSLPRRLLMLLVRGYRFFLSPWLQTSCRYEPTCSAYSLEALGRHGALVGSYMTLHRLLRCHPLCEGGHDPVPEHAPRLFRGLFTGTPRAAGTPSSTSLDNQTSP